MFLPSREHNVQGRLGGWVPKPCLYGPGHLSWKAGASPCSCGSGGASESLAEEGGALGAREWPACPLPGPGCSRPGWVAPAARSGDHAADSCILAASALSVRPRAHGAAAPLGHCCCSRRPRSGAPGRARRRCQHEGHAAGLITRSPVRPAVGPGGSGRGGLCRCRHHAAASGFTAVSTRVPSHRPAEELSVTWRRNGVTIASGPHSFGRQLTISAPTSSDTGAYVCEAARRGGASARASAQAFLSIIGSARPGGVAGAGGGGARRLADGLGTP